MKSITMQVAEWIEQQESFTVKDIQSKFLLSCREASGCLQYTKRIGYVYNKERLFGNSFRYSLEAIELEEKEDVYVWLSDPVKSIVGDYRELHRITGLDRGFCHRVWNGKRKINKKHIELIDRASKRKDLMKLALGF